MTDVIYLDFSKEGGRVKSVQTPGGLIDVPVNIDVGTESSLQGLALNFAGGYTLVNNKKLAMDILLGARLFSVDVESEWRLSGPQGNLSATGKIKQSEDIWDGIIGTRGNYRLNHNWSIPFYLDMGTGDSDLTWQAMSGIGYDFSWGQLKAVYRHIEYDMGKDGLLENFRFSGPAIGATFKF